MSKTFKLLLILICGSPLILFAQDQRKMDSLLHVLSTQKEDTFKLRTYLSLIQLQARSNYTSGPDYINQFLALSIQSGNIRYESLATNALGDYYMITSNYEMGLKYVLRYAQLSEQLNDTAQIIEAYNSLSQMSLMQSKHDTARALQFLSKSESLAKIVHNYVFQAMSSKVHGDIYFYQNNFRSALKYYKNGLNIARTHNIINITANLSNEVGLTYKELHQLDSAMYYLEISKHYSLMEKVSPNFRLSFLYGDIASTQTQMGNYQSALRSFDTSNYYAQKINNLQAQMDNYLSMAQLYETIHDYKSQAIYLKKSYALKDSIFTTNKQVQMTKMYADYQLGKQNLIIARQEAENLKQKNQRNIFLFTTIGICSVLGALLFFYRRIQQKNNLLATQNVQISTQKEELLQLNSLKDRLFGIISHDLRNPIVTLQSYLAISENTQLSEDKRQKYKQQTHQAIRQTGDMLDNLLTWSNLQIKNTDPDYTLFSLDSLIDDTIANVEAQLRLKHLQIEKNILIASMYSDDTIIQIVLRNLLTNAIKYSHPNSIIYISSSEKNNNTLLLSIQDQGIGLSQAQIHNILHNDIESTNGTQGEKGTGLGLYLIKELLHKINGQLSITSEVGVGSIFTIELPNAVGGDAGGDS